MYPSKLKDFLQLSATHDTHSPCTVYMREREREGRRGEREREREGEERERDLCECVRAAAFITCVLTS